MREILGRFGRATAVRRLRQIAETLVTPRVRGDLSAQHARLLHVENRLGVIEPTTGELSAKVTEIERHLPRLLNAIASSDGAARLLRRELDDLRDLVEGAVGEHERVDDAVQSLTETMAGHADTQRWLLGRVEMIRAEMLYELRYGAESPTADESELTTAQIVEPAVLDPEDGRVRLNLGCGHRPLPGFANVDSRKLPGVDIVARVDGLPVEPGTVTEIFSAHLLEHFPEEQLRRSLLPYWIGLLRPGGTFRAVVPDLEAMARAYVAGDLDFEVLRMVTYGGQEYEGDAHFTGFTVEHLSAMFSAAGLTDVTVIATGRPEGDCLELELSATLPA